MDKKTKGSWLVHHANKLQGVVSQSGYEKTFLAGKAGILLSAISSNSEIRISNQRIETLAQAANINTTFERNVSMKMRHFHQIFSVPRHRSLIMAY